MKRKTIRGVGGEKVVVELADFVYVEAHQHDHLLREHVRIARLTLAGARRLHAALGELLASKPKRRRRS